MRIKRYSEYLECKHSIYESVEYGTREQISSWLDSMGITNYTINEDLSVDVDAIVSITGSKLTEIPIKFNRIDGHFLCYSNKLTTLKNCPNYVANDFSCSNNQLYNLEHSPRYIGGYFRCRTNGLTSLTGIPIEIKLDDLYCDANILSQNELKWNWLEFILSTDESNITYHIEWNNKHKDTMPDDFKEKFGYLLEFEHYTKTLK